MTRPVLICRPQPGADATAARARELGMEALVCPLFAVEPLDWSAPAPASFDALMLTSANALRHGGEGLSRYHALPMFAVGAATARAAMDAGFTDVVEAGPDAPATLERIARAGHRHILHLGGEHFRAAEREGLTITRRAVYRSAATGTANALTPMLERSPVLLVHSPRAGARIAALIPEARRADIALIAISAAARDAAGTGWAQAIAASAPQDDVMLALARPLCL